MRTICKAVRSVAEDPEVVNRVDKMDFRYWLVGSNPHADSIYYSCFENNGGLVAYYSCV